MSELNALFEQILHSERNFKARISKLKALSSQIQQSQAELQQVKDEAHTLSGEMAVKNSRLADLEATCRLLTVRRDIFQDQKEKLMESKAEISRELGAASAKLESLRQSLLEELTEFGLSYDLHGSGYRYREEQAKRRIAVFQEELMLLEAELTDMDCQKGVVEKLKGDLASIETAVEKERDEEKDLKEALAQQELELRQLESDKEGYSRKSSRNPEFIRLQQELQSCKECSEEAQCQSLSKELEELQRQCYHKQMRRQLNLQNGRVRNNCKSSGNSASGTGSVSRRPGHYNPYTHQYVPAPSSASKHSIPAKQHSDGLIQKANKVSLNDQVKNQCLEMRSGAHGNSSKHLGDVNSSLDTDSLTHEVQGSPDSDMDDMNIIGDDWLLEDEDEEDEGRVQEGGQGGSHWAVELDENELASLSNELDSFSSDVTVALDTDTYEDNIRQDSSVDVCTPNSPPLESNSTSRTFRGNWRSVVFIPQDQRAVQPRPSETHGPGGRNRLLTASTGEGSEQTQRGRGRSQGIAPSSHTVDSPNPLTVAPRKRRPGQSIYKAPGQERQSNFSLPKSAKKVRFHH